MKSKYLLLFIFAIALLPIPVFAQECASWTKFSPASSPPARIRHAFAYSPAIKKALVFGGTGFLNSTITILGDTWLWNSAAQNWEGPLSFPSGPSARYGSSAAYDAVRNVMIMFGGGASDNSPLGDTWEFDGSNWRNVTPASSPAPRVFHSLSFSQALGQVVLFGGISGSTLFQDTWGWNGSQWNKITDFKPSARELQSLAYDEVRNRPVLFGGYDGLSYVSDTWELVGTDWQQATLNTSPSARIESAFAFLPTVQQTILFGGLAQAGTQSDTWSWDGATWQQRSVTGPSARRGAMSTYDSTLAGVLLFGGTNDTGSIFDDTWLYSAVDSDKDGTADCIDTCPTDPLKISAGLCGCGVTDSSGCIAAFSSILPTKPALKIVNRNVRVQMRSHPNVRYILSYYDTRKLRGKAKPKVITINSRKPAVSVRNLVAGRKYAFSYRYQQKNALNAFSRVSAKKAILVKFKSGGRR